MPHWSAAPAPLRYIAYGTPPCPIPILTVSLVPVIIMEVIKDVNHVRDELKGLLQKQTETLKAQTFGGLSQREWNDFERRRERIHDLTVLLLTLSVAADRAA